MEENKQYTAQVIKRSICALVPGCGDHAIVNVLQKAMAELGVPPILRQLFRV